MNARVHTKRGKRSKTPVVRFYEGKTIPHPLRQEQERSEEVFSNLFDSVFKFGIMLALIPFYTFRVIASHSMKQAKKGAA